ncbi:hypothetical protein EVAR_6871_1 [Eumeta japonica]|uniref:Uncharacterized protein n=1 Tax=Eumeta variegata TaxID=151549 RepID=A0A4C1TJ99_EUMVA|nr:hypothetical protein EVAR_6871_1 [Eumeta japonica]
MPYDLYCPSLQKDRKLLVERICQQCGQYFCTKKRAKECHGHHTAHETPTRILTLRGREVLCVVREDDDAEWLDETEVNTSQTSLPITTASCNQHKVHAKSYGCTLVVNEEDNVIVTVQCQDCVASQGGCKHAIAFLMWVHRRSEELACTSRETATLKRAWDNLKTNARRAKAEERASSIRTGGGPPPSQPPSTSILDEVGEAVPLLFVEIPNDYDSDGLLLKLIDQTNKIPDQDVETDVNIKGDNLYLEQNSSELYFVKGSAKSRKYGLGSDRGMTRLVYSIKSI